jgi:hypothetical protein
MSKTRRYQAAGRNSGGDAMSLTPEELYLELGRLMARMPEIDTATITPEIDHWLSRAVALVQASGGLAEAIQLMAALEHLDGGLWPRKAATIADIVQRTLTRVESDAPPAVQGAVITVGDRLDAYMAVRKVLGTAKADVLLVDPHAGAKVLTDYAVLASDRVTVRLLADEAEYEESLMTAARRWAQQLGNYRTLMARLAPQNTLHDRLILVDSATVWVLGQSFNNLAKRSRTSLVRARPEAAAHKIAVYAEIWDSAKPLLPP